jgi:alpha-D-ribose 1-methylphosphonate 5-triphosphate synthase subunit PhnH
MIVLDQATSAAAAMTAGFDNPVMQSQAAFRIIMSAMAEPGRWLELAGDLDAPAGLSQPAAIALLTLADFETPVWLPHDLREGPAGAWLRFHCGCPLIAEPAKATFALIHGTDPAMPRLGDFNAGEDRYPDQSTTILVVCEHRDGGFAVDLSGPGIETSLRVAPAGPGQLFWSDAIANSLCYPLGADLMLVDGTHIMGLPRSTQIGGAT